MSREDEITERLRAAYVRTGGNSVGDPFVSQIAREIAAARGDAPEGGESLVEQHERHYREWRDAVAERHRVPAQPAPDASAAGGWQPIETAPKDGRRVLLWSAAWHDDPSSGWFGGVRGWYLAYEAGPFKHQPTHWMPLPPPPASATEGESPVGEAETPHPLTPSKGGGDA